MNIMNLIEQIKWIPSISITFIDIFQMAIITFVLWYLAKSLYKTRAWILVKGLLVIGVIYIIICLTEMTVLKIIMQGMFSSLLIAIVIMLQPELQKIVELIGKRRLVDLKPLILKKSEAARWYSEKTIYEIAAACEIMSAAKTGALIAIERGIPLTEYSRSGIKLGSDVSNQLLINIFEKNTPLHDGAVIISNDKIESATCYLPLSMNYSIDKILGTRHRAAIGISETTDCVVVVVSEETGAISVCVDGNIQHNINRLELTDELKKLMYKNEEKMLERHHSKTPMWIKAFAPILSIIIWMSVVSANDPIVTKTIRDVPVITINTEALDAVGHTYVIQSGHTIDVRVEGRRSLVDGMTKDDLYAKADFTQMSIVYSVPIDVEVSEPYNDVQIITFKDHTMILAIEDMVQTEIPVVAKIDGDVNGDYAMKVDNLEIETMTITCPQSVAQTLDKAVVTVDAYGKTNRFMSTIEPVIYDKNGHIVPQSKVILNQSTIRVVVDVQAVKEIPVNVKLTTQDTTANTYYVLKEYFADSKTVRVAADDTILSALTELTIVITPESYDNGTNNILVNLQTYLPNGAYLANDQAPQLTIGIDLTMYQKMTIDLDWDTIKLTGFDKSATKATVLEAPKSIILYYDTKLIAPDMIISESLRPTIKVSAKEDGTYAGTLSLTDIDGVNVISELRVKYSLQTLKKGER